MIEGLDELEPLPQRLASDEYDSDGNPWIEWYPIPRRRELANDLAILQMEQRDPGSSGLELEQLRELVERLYAAGAIDLDTSGLDDAADTDTGDARDTGDTGGGGDAATRAADSALDAVAAAADAARLAAAQPFVVETLPAGSAVSRADPARVLVLRRALERHGERLRARLAAGDVPPGYTPEDVAEALA